MWIKAVSNGLRLAKYAGLFWSAFADSMGDKKGKIEIGMEWVSLAIEELITSNSADDHANWVPTAEKLSLAVQGSGFAQAVEHIYFPAFEREAKPKTGAHL